MTDSSRVLYTLAMWQPIVASLGVFSVLFILLFCSMERGEYALDPAAGAGRKGIGTFEPHGKNYLELSKLVIGLGSASIGATGVLFFGTNAALTTLSTLSLGR